MKRVLCIILVLALFLPGCALGQERMKEPVTFYFLRQHTSVDDYDVFFSEGAVGSEIREAAGHREDLNYLLTLYLQGPLDSNLKAIFPLGSKVMDTKLENGKLTIIMNALSFRSNEMEQTISCACLAKTCMELTGAEVVTIESFAPDNHVLVSRTFTAENLLFTDTSTLPVESTE